MGINIKRLPDGCYTFSQRTLIDIIINEVGLAPSDYTNLFQQSRLHIFLDSPPFKQEWNCRSVVGKLNYLAQTSGPDILYATHMVAKYASNSRKEHGKAILCITQELGLHFKPNSSKGLYCYADADFSGEWNRDFAQNNQSTAKSRSDIWCSKLQSQVALSTTETEYIALSQALRDVILVMSLLGEMREHKFNVILVQPRIYCKAFEDNSGALELARLAKLQPQTEHINVCYHHFCKHKRANKNLSD
ncbi:LOW QUALITY PROTEIN: hypothetical protein ACHAW6_003083 [Cyclotella cf. meneghiniana]